MNRRSLLLLMLFLLPALAFGQRITVTGTVTSVMENNISLPGVTVMVKNTSQGTTSDINGRYRVEANANDTLVFSYVGMVTTEIPIMGQIQIDVGMELDVARLGEVIVVGYGTESSRLVSGSLGVVSETEIRDVPLRTIDGVLQGRSAGVQISQNSGTPGSATTVRIRGNSSITAGNQPLYVIDGIPMITGNYGQVGFSGQGINALSDINPSDIESITVLKDASAAAIYGARATNGVILITTRRGSKQRTNITFNASSGIQEVVEVQEMINAEQWHEYKGTQPDPGNPVDVDWLDKVFRVAPMSSYEFSASGGDASTRFFISGNYYNQEGVLLGTDYQRLNGRLNLDHTMNEHVKLGASFGASYSLNNRVEGDRSLNGVLPNALTMPPIHPVYNEDDTYNEDGPYANPVAIGKEAINEAHSFRTLGNAFVDITFLKHLTVSTKWGFDYLSLREHSFDPPTTRQGARSNGIGIAGQNNVLNIVSNNLLRYSNSFKGLHNLEALAGYSFEIFQRRNQYARGVDFPGPFFEYLAEAATITSSYARAVNRGMSSYFGQVKYNYDYRYIVTLSGRYDGSTKFGENNKYGFFPAVSLAWRVTEESFFQPLNDIFDEFRMRASYGLTGNDGIPDFAYLNLYGGGANYLGGAGIVPSQLPNPDLKWETTAQINVGLDLAVLDERISLAVDYYHNRTKDLLFDRPVSMTSGFYSITTNIGELENRGIELSLTTVNVRTEAFEWDSRLNISRNRNKILSLYKNQPLDNLDRYSPSIVMVGEPMSIFFGYRSLGVDPSTGDIVFDDVNGDGIINAEDRVKIGDPNPKFTGGFTNNLTYKQFELSLFLQFSYGNDIFNANRVFIEAMKGADNQSTAILRRWRQPGDITDIPRATENDPNNNNRISSRFVEDGSYLRIKNLTFSYLLNQRLAERLKLRSTRIFLSAQNLLTFTNYSGMDPEVNYTGDSNLLRGTDFFTYPQARTFSIGINLGL
ncbi:MAG: TonB-dependent receptor [Bacteroides sp.]|nr:TonB-dependent receptor [Bacteroides sp.]